MSETKIALVVGAHPDDCDFGAGGTAWTWAQEGWEVHFLIVTDGSRGTSDPKACRQTLKKVRQDEQRASAQLLGVTACHFLDYEDGSLEYSDHLIRELVRTLRTVKPTVVFTHTPQPLDYRPFDRSEGTWINHKDHRAVSLATLDAVYPCARDPLQYSDLNLASHKVATVYLWGSAHCDFEVASEGGLEHKSAALACHQSQFPDTDWEALKKSWGHVERFQTVRLPI